MRFHVAAALSLVLLARVACAQSQKSISQSTGGECSPAVVSEGKVTITCIGLDQQQQALLRKVPSLIDQLLKRSQSDRDLILGKLEEILKLQKDAEARNADRHLTLDQKTILKECLRPTPGKFSIGALGGNAEAYGYAQDWHDLLIASGWEIEHKDIPINIFMIGGGMLTGMHINLHGTMVQADRASLIDGSPEKNFYERANKAQISGAAIPYAEIPSGSVRIDISSRP